MDHEKPFQYIILFSENIGRFFFAVAIVIIFLVLLLLLFRWLTKYFREINTGIGRSFVRRQ